MKRIAFILLLSALRMCGVTPCPAQLTAPAPFTASVDSGYWISKSAIIAASNGIYRLKRDSAITAELLKEYRLQVRDLKAQNTNKDSMLAIAFRIHERERKIQESLEAENKDLKEKAKRDWTESPWLWMGLGALALLGIQRL